MTYDQLADLLIARWNESRRISTGGRAIVISAEYMRMIEVALRGAEAMASLADLPPKPLTSR